MKIPRSISARARKIKLIAMDVDGVLTGGEIIVLDSGEELKIWNVKDGLGIHLARRAKADIRFAWITGRASKQVAVRAKDMDIDALYQSCMQKREAMEKILKKFGLKPEEAAFLGDDLVDVPVFRIVGLGISPKDAPAEVLKEADYISRCKGGEGVLREAIEIVLKSRGLWKKATEGYL